MGCCDCCDPKRGAGKCLVFFFTIVFGVGVIISACVPNWIGFLAKDDSTQPPTYYEVNWGPFYGQYRTCTENAEGYIQDCGDWEKKEVNTKDCDAVPDDLEKLCGQLAGWRFCAIICLILTLIGGLLVFAASCCQVVTCGCCGNSLTCISNVLFGTEVILSIAAWSLAIASLRNIQTSPHVSSEEYQWGFWLFLGAGTIFGALATWMADWAAEDSCLRGVSHAIQWFIKTLWGIITCKSCRKGGDDEDDRGEPLIGNDRV